MHFAFPTKDKHPPYALRSPPSRPFTTLRRNGRLQSIAIVAVGSIGLLWLVYHILFAAGSSRVGGSGRPTSYAARNAPKAVIVTMFDGETSAAHEEAIKDNRRDYASRHGYTTFFTNTSSYSLPPATPKSWSILPSLRHAMTQHPHTPYIFYLSPTALIMTPSLSLETHLMNPARLEKLMLPDKPVVPPDSVIRTFSHVKGGNVDFVLTQDDKGLSPASMVVRTGDWAKYLLDAWFDPLYRSYNFQRAERHALEHIVQWHGTILSRLALVPQRTMNAYVPDPADPATGKAPDINSQMNYEEGDFVANFAECAHRKIAPPPPQPGKRKSSIIRTRNECEVEMAAMVTRWREMVDREGRGKGRKAEGVSP